jgi:hypothetical protein
MGPAEKFIQLLEAERLDITYRKKKTAPIEQEPEAQAPAKPKTSRPTRSAVIEQAMNKLYFDAGRYQAGARDRESIEAHMKLQSRMNATKNKKTIN